MPTFCPRLTHSSGNEQVESELGRLLLQIVGLIIIINKNRLQIRPTHPFTQSSSHQNSGSEILSIRELSILPKLLLEVFPLMSTNPQKIG